MPERRRQPGFAPADVQTTAVFARVPASAAAKLNQASVELKRPKQELIAMLLDRYLDVLGEEWAVGRASVAAEPLEVLTLEQLAELLKVEVDVVRALAERGEIPGRKVGATWRFSRSAVLDWLRG